MKKVIIYSIAFVLAFVLLQGCKDVTTEGFTQITSYPVLTMNGNDIVFVNTGGTFDDPGISAVIDGEDVTEDVVVKSNLDLSKAGKYVVNYSVTNKDGLSVEKSRIVYVYNSTPSSLESKFYTVGMGTNRNGTIAYSGYKIAVYQIEPGVFAISDFLGGYYDVRAGYGSSYAMVGSFKLNSDNSLSLISSFVAGWGDSLDGLSNGVFDPELGKISYTASYAKQYNFNVILN